jgi:hypothetical protein
MAPGGFTVAGDGSKLTFAALAQSLPCRQQMLCVKPCLDALCEFDLVGGIEQRRFADAIQVHAYKISGWTLRVQIVVNAGCGGVRHNGLLVGSNCHEL